MAHGKTLELKKMSLRHALMLKSKNCTPDYVKKTTGISGAELERKGIFYGRFTPML